MRLMELALDRSSQQRLLDEFPKGPIQNAGEDTAFGDLAMQRIRNSPHGAPIFQEPHINHTGKWIFSITRNQFRSPP